MTFHRCEDHWWKRLRKRWLSWQTPKVRNWLFFIAKQTIKSSVLIIELYRMRRMCLRDRFWFRYERFFLCKIRNIKLLRDWNLQKLQGELCRDFIWKACCEKGVAEPDSPKIQYGGQTLSAKNWRRVMTDQNNVHGLLTLGTKDGYTSNLCTHPPSLPPPSCMICFYFSTWLKILFGI